MKDANRSSGKSYLGLTAPVEAPSDSLTSVKRACLVSVASFPCPPPPTYGKTEDVLDCGFPAMISFGTTNTSALIEIAQGGPEGFVKLSLVKVSSLRVSMILPRVVI